MHRSGQRKRGTRKSRGTVARRRRNANVSVPRDKLGFPQSMRATLRYTDKMTFELASNTNAIVSTFRANDLFDPRYALGGHQPRSFDQYMGLFNNFTVTSSTCSVNFMYQAYDGPTTENVPLKYLVKNSGADSSEPPALPAVVCGVHKGIELLSGGTGQDQIEKDRTQWKILTPAQQPNIKAKLKVSDFFGKTDLVGSEGYGGTDATSPDNPVFWEVWCAHAGHDAFPDADEIRVVAFVTIEYNAVFTDPKTLTAS